METPKEMLYSVIKMQGGKFCYHCHQENKPNIAGVEGTRQFLHWQNQLQIYPIADACVEAFGDFATDSRVAGQDGMPIPYLMVELYKEGNVVHARRKSMVDVDGLGNIATIGATCAVCESEFALDVSKSEHKHSLAYMCRNCRLALKDLVEERRVKLGIAVPTIADGSLQVLKVENARLHQ